MSLQFTYLHDYEDLNRQIGKMTHKLHTAADEQDLDRAIKLVRSARGDAACVLKILHRIRRNNRLVMKVDIQ